MKKLLVIALLLVAASASGITPKEVSKWRIPGQRTAGQCVKYAVCTNYRLFTKNVDSRMVAYHFANDKGIGHAVVLFCVNGQWYLIENERDTAVPVTGSNDLERVRSFDADATELYQPATPNVGGYLAELEKVSK